MKRYVYVPVNLLGKNKDIPEDAVRISKLAKLPIRIGEENEFKDIKNVEIICAPEKKSISFDKQVESNFLQTIKYENDFITLTKKTECLIKFKDKQYNIYPTIVEKHCAKYNHRFSEVGIYIFCIVDEGNVVSEEYCFEVV